MFSMRIETMLALSVLRVLVLKNSPAGKIKKSEYCEISIDSWHSFIPYHYAIHLLKSCSCVRVKYFIAEK